MIMIDTLFWCASLMFSLLTQCNIPILLLYIRLCVLLFTCVLCVHARCAIVGMVGSGEQPNVAHGRSTNWQCVHLRKPAARTICVQDLTAYAKPYWALCYCYFFVCGRCVCVCVFVRCVRLFKAFEDTDAYGHIHNFQLN